MTKNRANRGNSRPDSRAKESSGLEPVHTVVSVTHLLLTCCTSLLVKRHQDFPVMRTNLTTSFDDFKNYRQSSEFEIRRNLAARGGKGERGLYFEEGNRTPASRQLLRGSRGLGTASALQTLSNVTSSGVFLGLPAMPSMSTTAWQGGRRNACPSKWSGHRILDVKYASFYWPCGHIKLTLFA